jgi:hypothetical protein
MVRARQGWFGLGLAIAVSATSGCGGSTSATADAAKVEADKKAEAEKLAEARREEIRKEREAKAAAEQKAADDRQAELDRLCVVPEGAALPNKLGDACTAVAESYDAFTRRHFADDADTLAKWDEGKEGQMQFTITTCKKAGSLEAAVCAEHALDEASAALREAAPEILRICMDKYGKDNTPPAD